MSVQHVSKWIGANGYLPSLYLPFVQLLGVSTSEAEMPIEKMCQVTNGSDLQSHGTKTLTLANCPLQSAYVSQDLAQFSETTSSLEKKKQVCRCVNCELIKVWLIYHQLPKWSTTQRQKSTPHQSQVSVINSQCSIAIHVFCRTRWRAGTEIQVRMTGNWVVSEWRMRMVRRDQYVSIDISTWLVDIY